MWHCFTSDEPGPRGFIPRLHRRYSDELTRLLSTSGDPSTLRPGESLFWATDKFPVLDYAVDYCRAIGLRVTYRKRGLNLYSFKCHGAI